MELFAQLKILLILSIFLLLPACQQEVLADTTPPQGTSETSSSEASYFEASSTVPQSGTLISGTSPFKRNGFISYWNASFDSSQRESRVRFLILRPNRNYYKIIYITEYFSTTSSEFDKDKSLIVFKEPNQVGVKSGDLVGFHYIKGNPVKFTDSGVSCDSSLYKELEPKLLENYTLTKSDRIRYQLADTNIEEFACRSYQFQAKVSALEGRVCSNFTARDTQGELQYPPESFPKNIEHNVCWVIATKEGYLIETTVVQVDVAPTSNCETNALTIKNGSTEDATEVARFCPGSLQKSHTVLSGGSSIFVSFRTDASDASQAGFLLKYRRVPLSMFHNLACKTIEVFNEENEFEFDTSKQTWPSQVLCLKLYHNHGTSKSLKLALESQETNMSCEDNFLQLMHENNVSTKICHSPEVQHLAFNQTSVFLLLHYNPNHGPTVMKIQYKTDDIMLGTAEWIPVLIIVAVLIFILLLAALMRISHERHWNYF